MEFPPDFLKRIGALRAPDAFVQQTLESLDDQEKRDALAPLLARRHEAWATLGPDLARRYAEAISTPWAAMMVRLEVTPQMIARRERTRRRLAYLRSNAPDAVRTRTTIRADMQTIQHEVTEAAKREKAAIRERLTQAELPLLPDLFLPGDLP